MLVGTLHTLLYLTVQEWSVWKEVGGGVSTLLWQAGTVWVGDESSQGCEVGCIWRQPWGHCYSLAQQVVVESRKGSRPERRSGTHKVIKVYTKPECGTSTNREHPRVAARPHPTVLLYKLHHVRAATDPSIMFVYIYLHKAVDSRPSDQGCHVGTRFSL